MKLKKSIMMIFLFISILPLSIFGLFSLYETNRKVDTMTDCNLKAVSENQISNIQNFAKDRKSEMEIIAHYKLTTDAIKNIEKDSGTKADRVYLDNLLRERKKYQMYVASISIMDKDFRIIGSSEQYERKGLSQLKNIDKKFHTGEFIMGNVYERVTDDGKKKLVPAYIGIYDDSNLIGYIAEELDTAYFDELRLNMDSLASGTFYVLDGDGEIITAGDTSQKQSINRFVTTSRERADFQKKWDAIDHEKNPAGEIKYRFSGDEYITYYANVDNSEWSIRVSENYSAQKRELKSFTMYIVLILGTLIIGTILIQSFFAQKVLNPIKNALQSFDQIKRTQDYSIRLSVNNKDEFGKMAEGINGLLDYIEVEKIHDKATQRKLKSQAESDPLTGIKNKKVIENTILDMVQLSVETGTQFSLGFLDVDNFRDFNTKYGHQAGDKVLKFVAETLQSTLKGEIGRIGGDEFVFCFTGNKTKKEMESDMQKLLEKLRDGWINDSTGEKISVPCSIGVITTFGDIADYTELIRAADKAMYKAKEAGRNTFKIHEMNEEI